MIEALEKFLRSRLNLDPQSKEKAIRLILDKIVGLEAYSDFLKKRLAVKTKRIKYLEAQIEALKAENLVLLNKSNK